VKHKKQYEMNESTSDRLYQLLPSLYQQRDVAVGEPLRAFLALLERGFQEVEEDIERLYDNWFVDTSQEWILSYLGDLLGVRDLVDEKSILMSQRRRIANAIRYRRRKGTAWVLENVVYDVTGWPVKGVEFFDRLSMTQSLANIRPDRGRLFDVREAVGTEQPGGPFDPVAHLMDLRLSGRYPSAREGLYQPSKLGLFLWRIHSYGLTSVQPVSLEDADGFFMNPMGRDMPLFNQADRNSDFSSLQAHHLPIRLTRARFQEDLDRHANQTPEADQTLYYGPGRSLNIVVKDHPVPPREILSVDLSQGLGDRFTQGADSPSVAVDVERGRIAFSPSFSDSGDPVEAEDVRVDFHYGFSGDIGGGPYDRNLSANQNDSDRWTLEIAKGSEIDTLEKALTRWEEYREQSGESAFSEALLRIVDNGAYLDEASIELPENSQLTLEAADGFYPTLTGKLTVTGPDAEAACASLIINGLRITKSMTLKGSLSLQMLHSTLMPSEAGELALAADPETARELRVALSHCMTGALRLPTEQTESLVIKDSIVDHQGTGFAVAADEQGEAWGASTRIERATLFGQLRVEQLCASEVICTEQMTVQRRQLGSICFSYAPSDSLLPIRYRCVPTADASSRLRPQFTSVQYGRPGYAQLRRTCPTEIRTGAENGCEMGVFNPLRHAQREENIKRVLHEYFPEKMEAGIVYVT